jgi:hypothetical protein
MLNSMNKLCFVVRVVSMLALVWGPGSMKSAGADLRRYVLQKSIQYDQTSQAAPSPDLNNGVIFDVVVKARGSNMVTSAAVTLPNGASLALTPDGDDEFQYRKKYNKQTSMDASFPNGQYTLTVRTSEVGEKTLPLPLSGELYPNTPTMKNFASLQGLDSGAFQLFGWEPFVGGGDKDFVQLRIEDSQGRKAWETPDLGQPGALNGRATSALMPPRTLAAGQTYQATLVFAKSSTYDTVSYPDAVGAALYCKRTRFAIQTGGTPSRAELKLYGIVKTRRFNQTGSSAPTIQTNKPFKIDIFAEAASASAVMRATVLYPNGATETLPPQADDKSFEFSEELPSQSALDTTYPNGTYSLQITTAAGLKLLPLELAGDLYPPAPRMSAAPSLLNPAQPWALSWEPFAGGTSDDYLQFRIEDEQGNKIYETPDLGKDEALDGTAVGVTIPANTLQPGQSYQARLTFQKHRTVDTHSVAGALGVASYASRTSFKFSTTGGETQRPSLQLALAPTGEVQIHVRGPAGRAVRVETSSDLSRWTLLNAGTLSDGGLWMLTDPQVGSGRQRFYRAVLPPS